MEAFFMKQIRIWFTLVLALALLVSCGSAGQGEHAGTGSNPEQKTTTHSGNDVSVAKSEILESGEIAISGSSTVFPIMQIIQESYLEKQPNVQVSISQPGTGAGMRALISGEVSFANASRKIKDKEIAELKEVGIEYASDVLELKLAYDGLTIVVHKDNTWATSMKAQEIIDLYTSRKYRENDQVLWSDVRSDWPNEPIRFYGPNENHGTYEFFWGVLMKKADMVKTAQLEQEYLTLVDLVANDRNAIAFFGYGYYEAQKDKLTAVSIDFGNGSPVQPAKETIGESLAYAGFTRPVYTYLNARHAADNPAIRDFTEFLLSSEGAMTAAAEVGFAPLSETEYVTQRKDLPWKK